MDNVSKVTIYYDWDETWEPHYESSKDWYNHPLEVSAQLWEEYKEAGRKFHALKRQLDEMAVSDKDRRENGKENNS